MVIAYHNRAVGLGVFNDKTVCISLYLLSCSAVVGMLRSTPEPYELIATTTLWSIHLLIFAKASVVRDITGIQVWRRTTGACDEVLASCPVWTVAFRCPKDLWLVGV